jgi:hypothetical protein
MLTFLVIIPFYYLILSTLVIPLCYFLMWLPHGIVSCYHPMLSSLAVIHVIIPCYQIMLSSRVIIPCYHIMLSYHAIIPVITPCYHPGLSFHVIIPCYHPMLSSHVISHVIIPCYHPMISSHIITILSATEKIKLYAVCHTDKIGLLVVSPLREPLEKMREVHVRLHFSGEPYTKSYFMS